MQLTLEKHETQTVDLQRLVGDLGQYVSFKPDWVLSPQNIFAHLIMRDKQYEVLGMRKRYDSFNINTGEPLPHSKVDGVLVTITGEDVREHQFSHEWFLENSSDYEK
ncbi:MAG: hypothetical protein IH934_04525 [Nanoarchaeota archaeon]|nr:hypothetical protein [Nanoarchaeota archaeon]